MKKHIIWSNMDLNIEDWRDDYKEYIEANEIDADVNDDDAVYDWMTETNSLYFDDEYINLNKELEGRILVISDLGLWYGRRQGYRILGTNIHDILYTGCGEYMEFYGDGHNIKGTSHHHDGTNYYLYRVIREDRNIDKLLNAIYNGEEITSSKLNYYTKSLYKAVANVYGWR